MLYYRQLLAQNLLSFPKESVGAKKMSEPNLLMHSMSEFRYVYREILLTCDALSIGEIGAEFGGNTRELLKYTEDVGGSLVSIDPAPDPSVISLFEGTVDSTLYIGKSLDVLPTLMSIPVWFIDGDHNWYTVFNELALIHELNKERNDTLIFLHDVGWPCSRRDFYYSPSDIPAEYLHPHSWDHGAMLDGTLGEGRGFRGAGQFAWATHLGGPKNGILTAVEDFLSIAEDTYDYRYVPGAFGLGVLVSKTHPAHDSILQILDPLHNNPLLSRLEENRLANYLEVINLQDNQAAIFETGKLSPLQNAAEKSDVSTALETTKLMEDKEPHEVFSGDIKSWFDNLVSKAAVFSFDCFDTILWRAVATPSDVFFSLAKLPIHEKFGISARIRRNAEAEARSRKFVAKRSSEVDLQEIYEIAAPGANQDDIQKLINEEISEEIRVCFPFAPVIDVLLEAKRLGKKVIIVSDTYLRETQLRALLSASLSREAYEAIDAIYCSCEFGIGKGEGLLKTVKSLPEFANQARIAHIGDNYHADYLAPSRAGVHATHFRAFTDEASDILRMQLSALKIVAPNLQFESPVPNVMHHVISQMCEAESIPEQIGLTSLGPLMTCFSEFISHTKNQLEMSGLRVKSLFLLRDGHLPFRAYNALFDDAEASEVSISRYAAFAASFRTKQDIEEYLAKFSGSKRFSVMAKQFLLCQKTTDRIIRRAQKKNDPGAEFITQILKPPVVDEIVSASKAFCARLVTHLEADGGVKKGDTLLLVDLGYEGTVQRRLQTVLLKEYGLNLFGCYLLALPIPELKKTRVGMLDAEMFDDRVLYSLAVYMAVIEDLCTSDGYSTVDYCEDGKAIGSGSKLPDMQYSMVKPIQDAAVAFVTRMALDPQRSMRDIRDFRHYGLSCLSRFIFFATESEKDYLSSFQLDMNMATDDTFQLFDESAALEGMRKRGLFYMHDTGSAVRMNYPVELRSLSLDLSSFLLLQNRFGLNFTQKDFSFRKLKLTVVLERGDIEQEINAEASHTYDGFYSLIIPIGKCEFDVRLPLGAQFGSVELLSVELIPVHALYTHTEESIAVDISDCVSLEGGIIQEERLLRLLSEESCLKINPNVSTKANHRYVIRVLMRPVGSCVKTLTNQ